MDNKSVSNHGKRICNRITPPLFSPLLDLSPELLHHIFDYCDIQTILLLIRCVCRKLYNIVNIYNRFELKYSSASKWNFKNLSHSIQFERSTSLIVTIDQDEKDQYQFQLKIIDYIHQFTRLRSLTFYFIYPDIINRLLGLISSNYLTSLSIYTKKLNTFELLSLIISKFNLRKLAMNDADIKYNEKNISWPINNQLVYLEIGTCSFDQYLIIIKEIIHLRIFIIKDCIFDKDYQMKNNELSNQSHTSLLKSLTIKHCTAFLEELEDLFSLTPTLNHLELIFNGFSNDSPLDGHHLEKIIKRKLPLINDFKFFFSNAYLYNSNNQLMNIKSLISPFQTSFWLEEKHWYVTCEHIYPYNTIVLYTTPIVPVNEDYVHYANDTLFKFQHRFSNWSSHQKRSLFQKNRYQNCSPLDKSIRSPDCPRNSKKGADRCKISTVDNICRFSNKWFDQTDKETEEEETLSILSCTSSYMFDNIFQDIVYTLAYDDTLIILNLSNNRIKDAGAQYLANALKHNTTLKILDLSGNEIGDIGVQYLLESLEKNTTLMTLNLNDISCQSSILIKSINKICNERPLVILDLSNKYIDDDQTEILAKTLKYNKTLISLYISKNRISYFGLKYLVVTLRNIKTLTTLDLSINQIGDKGMEVLVNNLRYQMRLTTLNISNNQITIDGIKILSDVLKHNKTLIKLDLSNNQIDSQGTQYLAIALEFNFTLTHLNISNSSIGVEGVQYVSNVLQKNKTLIELFLANNRIGNFGIQYLSDALKNNTTLMVIDLSDNNIEDQGALYLINALRMNEVLKAIYLGGNSISDEICNELRSIDGKQSIKMIV